MNIKNRNGGGWIPRWIAKYHNGHRGLIGFALEVDDIEATYQSLLNQNVEISSPEPLKFKWFFNLLNKTMPWKNSYLAELEGVPFQFFLQQLNDEKSKVYLQQYMVPNSRENNIQGIAHVKVYGRLTENDKSVIKALFQYVDLQEEIITISIGEQLITFIDSDTYKVEVLLYCNNHQYSSLQLEIGNLFICNN